MNYITFLEFGMRYEVVFILHHDDLQTIMIQFAMFSCTAIHTREKKSKYWWESSLNYQTPTKLVSFDFL